MSEFDAQRVAERIDIVLDILVAGDYHSAIHNLEILKAELLRQVAESTWRKSSALSISRLWIAEW